ncbi:hypothetical protein [Streptomyces sp. NPDC006309]|uniref:hypothetical protein n=1 Tax=Streptomyces sp. NPDC006309 TaxID=3156749 RepID=UPI0033AE85B3
MPGAKADGELRAAVSPDRLARFLVGACTGMRVYSQLATQRAELLLPSIAPESAADGIQIDSGRVPAS